MGRIIVFLVTAFLAGAGLSYYLTGSHQPAIGFKALPAHSGDSSRQRRTAKSSPLPDAISDASALFQSASELTSEQLIALIQQTASGPPSRDRDFALSVLLRRLSQMDPGVAVGVARSHELASPLVKPLYVLWAQADPLAVMQVLRHETHPGYAMDIALSLHEALGGDTDAMSQVVDVLPDSVDKSRFQIEAVAQSAASSPQSAITNALALDSNSSRNQALRRVAAALAEADPLAALAAGESLTDKNNRSIFLSRVIRDWAQANPSAVLEYLEAQPDPGAGGNNHVHHALDALAMEAPQRLLLLADQWTGHVAQHARDSALQRWAESDPLAAFDAAMLQPAGQGRQHLLHGVAQAYGQNNPDAALQWADNLTPRSPGIAGAVIRGIAKENPDRAFELAVNLAGPEQHSALTGIIMQASSTSDGMAVLADKLLSIASVSVRNQTLQMFTSMWSSDQPEAAMTWLLDNHETIGSQAFRQFAQQLVNQDAVAAAKLTDRVPADARGAWIVKVAAGYARTDTSGALTWLDKYQGQPGYEAALAEVVSHTAQLEPARALQLLNRITTPELASQAAGRVATGWAASDPLGAASWASRLDNADVRGAAVAGALGQWARQDPAAAGRWALRLSPGAVRDQGLRAVLSGSRWSDTVDESILRAISDDKVRQQAAMQLVYAASQHNVSTARTLLERYVTDESMLQHGQQMLARMGQ